MYMLIMVLVDTSRLDEVINAWMKAGVEGATVLESTGMEGVVVREQAHSLYMGFSQMFGTAWVMHKTLFALIPSLAMADTAVAATEEIVGDLDEARNGIIFVLPVAKAWGLGY